MRPFKRKQVSDITYFRQLIKYIHCNPVEAGLAATLQEWNFSSYSQLLSDHPTFLQKNEVISWFEDEENFRQFHSDLSKTPRI